MLHVPVALRYLLPNAPKDINYIEAHNLLAIVTPTGPRRNHLLTTVTATYAVYHRID